MTTTKTRTVAGHKLSLRVGVQYIASRPMADGRRTFDVSIRKHDDSPFYGKPAAVIPGLSYDDANAFLAAFNNGAMSFDGRTW